MTTKTESPSTAALSTLMRLMAEKKLPPQWAKAAATRYRRCPEVWALVLCLVEQTFDSRP